MKFWGLAPPSLLRELAANVAMGVPAIRRRRLLERRTGSDLLDREAGKIIAEFDFLLDSAGPLHGRTVLEIGPGDALGLAPLFISAGAVRYIALDRFLGDVWGTRAESLYEEIAARRGPFVSDWRQRVQLIRHSIESTGTQALADLLVSFDVVEHLADLPRAVRHMAALLKPSGRMIHRVDYGPHGVWLTASDPLSFLRVPGWLWSAIGSNRGYPNRVRHAQFVQLLREQNLYVQERITGECGKDVLDAEIVCGRDAQITLGRPFRLDGTDTHRGCSGSE